METILIYAPTLLCVVVIVFVIAHWKRIKSIEASVDTDGLGLKIELSELVKQEVARVSLASLSRIAQMDQKLIGFWEDGKNISAGDSTKRLALITAEIAELESKLGSAPVEDRFQIANQLREMYWKHLDFSRQHSGAGGSYSADRARAIEGLKKIEAIGKEKIA